MSLSEALRELESCEHMKITARGVLAWRFRIGPGRGPRCHVQVRRRRQETFEQMIRRAAVAARSGYRPVPTARDLARREARQAIGRAERSSIGLNMTRRTM